jgi:two-component system, OmpR family, sensor histidine kinase KdpD
MAFSSQAARRLSRVAASAFMVAAITCVAYGLHAKAFVAGFLYLLLILPIAFEWGFIEATFVSFMAVACLDFFFTQPLFTLYMSDPQDWVALGAFEALVLSVSHLAGRLRHQAAETAAQQANVDRLYTMSKDLLLFDRGEPVGDHLARLIVQVFGASAVALWNAHDDKVYAAGEQGSQQDEMRHISLSDGREDDRLRGRYTRPLSQGSRMLGALCIVSGNGPGRIDWRTADAIASLTVIALEREHAFLAESRAEAARQSERLRSGILDGLAHAYKTPLASIQTASSGLLEINRLDEVEKELAMVVQREAQHLADLTTQALQTARMDAEQLKLRPEPIALRPFLQKDWSPFVQGLAEHALVIESNEAGRTVWADPRLLQMAVAQLLDNASKYSKPATPIQLRVSDTDSETVFSIHNSGSYISPVERGRVFERFYRSPESCDRAPGTGIGLTVSRQIAEAHRGRIWIESDPEVGTTFHLGLPINLQGDR